MIKGLLIKSNGFKVAIFDLFGIYQFRKELFEWFVPDPMFELKRSAYVIVQWDVSVVLNLPLIGSRAYYYLVFTIVFWYHFVRRLIWRMVLDGLWWFLRRGQQRCFGPVSANLESWNLRFWWLEIRCFVLVSTFVIVDREGLLKLVARRPHDSFNFLLPDLQASNITPVCYLETVNLRPLQFV